MVIDVNDFIIVRTEDDVGDVSNGVGGTDGKDVGEMEVEFCVVYGDVGRVDDVENVDNTGFVVDGFSDIDNIDATGKDKCDLVFVSGAGSIWEFGELCSVFGSRVPRAERYFEGFLITSMYISRANFTRFSISTTGKIP